MFGCNVSSHVFPTSVMNSFIYWTSLQLSRLMTKPTKWPVRPAKTQISQGVRPVWSESSLSTWRNGGSSATQWVHCEDSDQTWRAQADLSLRWAHRSFCWFCHEVAHIIDEPRHEKPVFGDTVCDQVILKSACSVTEAGWSLGILDIASIGV